jgi:hypothetical protein
LTAIFNANDSELFNRIAIDLMGSPLETLSIFEVSGTLQKTSGPGSSFGDESMSEIFTALRVLETERHDQNTFRNSSQPPHFAMSAGTNEFSSRQEFTTFRVLEQQDPRVGLSQPPPKPLELTVSPKDYSAAEETTRMLAMELEQQQAEVVALTVNVSDFADLEQRIVRAVEVVKREREGRVAAEERAMHAEAELNAKTPRIEALESEIQELKNQRDHGFQRIEQLFALLDSVQL